MNLEVGRWLWLSVFKVVLVTCCGSLVVNLGLTEFLGIDSGLAVDEFCTIGSGLRH